MAGNDTDQLAPGRQSPESRSRRWRIVRRLVIATVIVLVLFYGGLGWVFSSKIQNDAFAATIPTLRPIRGRSTAWSMRRPPTRRSSGQCRRGMFRAGPTPG